MSERRYSEEEVARIIERATEAQTSGLPSPSSEGLTLREIQDVAGEVGLPADLVARAAKSIDLVGQAHQRKLFGFIPVGVGRTVELERPLTDAEWHRVVADLRETFDARGRLSEQGPFKQWTNGNLQALLEPTPTGQRVRLKTFKGSAMSSIGFGLTAAAVFAFMFVDELLGGGIPAERVANVAVFLGIFLGVAGVNLLRLPSWAKERAQQMEAVAERLSLMTSSSAKPPDDDR